METIQKKGINYWLPSTKKFRGVGVGSCGVLIPWVRRGLIRRSHKTDQSTQPAETPSNRDQLKIRYNFKRRRIKHDKGCSNPCVSYVKWRISAFNLAHKRRLSPINRRIANRKRQINQHNRAETPSNRDAAPIENRTVFPPNKYREEKNISKRRTSKRRILLQINWSEFRGTTSLLQRKQNIFNQLSLRGDFRNPVTKKSENGQSSFNKFTNFTGVQYSHFMLFWPVPHMSDRTHTCCWK